MFGKNKTGLALSGGSALGISHIGVIKSLKENEIEIDLVAGTSAGAIIAAAFAFQVPTEQMVQIAEKLQWKNISGFAYSKLGLATNKPLGKILKEVFGEAKVEEAKIPLAIIATNIENGEKVTIRKGDLVSAILASSCLPGIFVPIEREGLKLIDGGWADNFPLETLREMGASKTIGARPKRTLFNRKVNNVFDVILNSFDALSEQRENLLSRKADVLIETNLKKYGYSDFKKAEEIISAGYETTNEMMPEIKKAIQRKKKVSFLKKIAKKIGW